MNYSDYRFTLDIQLHQAQVSVPVTFNDSARRLCIGLTDGRKPYIIGEGCMAVFNAKKPDGTKIKNYCVIENNTVIYEFTPQTTSCEGIVNCDITIYDIDGKALTSPQFIIVVDEKVVRDDDITIVSEDESTILNGIIADEIKRQSAEDDRFREEIARADAERTRIENENIRISYEDQRQYNEEKRKKAEEVRDDAETMRGIAEDARVEAETARRAEEYGNADYRWDADRQCVVDGKGIALLDDQVGGRYGAELSRIDAEQNRSMAFYFWQNAETARVEAETARDGAEKERDNAEFTRNTNEQAREWNEARRKEAETAREALIGDIGAALDAIIAIQESLLPPKTLKFMFTEDGTTHHLEFEEGMTWAEWCDSEYNTLGLYISEWDTVYYGVSGVFDRINSENPHSNTPIHANYEYIMQ